MKNNEFKRRVEELGFTVTDHNNIYLNVTDENGDVAWVSTTHKNALGNMGSLHLDAELVGKLFDILIEYARTPVDDRKEKYSIYPIWTRGQRLVRFDVTFSNFGYEDGGSFGIYSGDDFDKNETVAFTESEAREICDYFGWDFDKVAVEVEDDE